MTTRKITESMVWQSWCVVWLSESMVYMVWLSESTGYDKKNTFYHESQHMIKSVQYIEQMRKQ